MVHILDLCKGKDTSTHAPHFQTIAHENPNVKNRQIIMITFILSKNLSHHSKIHPEFLPL